MSKISFEGVGPFDGRSLRLLDFMARENLGLPMSIYSTRPIGSCVKPDGWYMEYTSDFERVILKPDEVKHTVGKEAKLVSELPKTPSPKISAAVNSIVSNQELSDYRDMFTGEDSARTFVIPNSNTDYFQIYPFRQFRRF